MGRPLLSSSYAALATLLILLPYVACGSVAPPDAEDPPSPSLVRPMADNDEGDSEIEVYDDDDNGGWAGDADGASPMDGRLIDDVEDSFYDPYSIDPSCSSEGDGDEGACWSPPASTKFDLEEYLEAETGGDAGGPGGDAPQKKKLVRMRDVHWGADDVVLRRVRALRDVGSLILEGGRSAPEGEEEHGGAPSSDAPAGSAAPDRRSAASRRFQKLKRPPVFLMPGLAATRLVAWSYKTCPGVVADIRVHDYVWMNVAKMIEMAAIDPTCWKECMTLGPHQTDYADAALGCKLRPDEGIDAISSLAPGSTAANYLVGGGNTVYAWLTQWLADNLGYDVSSLVGLPFDWRLSPDMTEERDGFLTATRKRIEAAVQSNGHPGIMVAHSMGNVVFRYFLEWLRVQLKEEAYARYKKAEKQEKLTAKPSAATAAENPLSPPGWMHSVSSVLPVLPALPALPESGLMQSVEELWTQLFPPEEEEGAAEEPLPDAAAAAAARPHPPAPPASATEDAFRELAEIEGEEAWREWIDHHVWTYVGLSAPLLGASGPMRSVISGENMGLPVDDLVAREMELSFGSTNTVNMISTRSGWDGNPGDAQNRARLASLRRIVDDIEEAKGEKAWDDYRTLRLLLRDKVDWDVDHPVLEIDTERCAEGGSPCEVEHTVTITPADVENGNIFDEFNKVWHEKDAPLLVKKNQLEDSFWYTDFPNILNHTWDRPPIKHVIMSYGVDISTEISYKYTKRILDGAVPPEYDGVPTLRSVVSEEEGGALVEQTLAGARDFSLRSKILKRKTPPRRLIRPANETTLPHSGDGTVPYISLAWAHTWLLHSARAGLHGDGDGDGEGDAHVGRNHLGAIAVSHRPKGGMRWVEGSGGDTCDGAEDVCLGDSSTGTSHPHGTKYKPEMVRYESSGVSRTTGMEYTTTVVEAIGVEHKETTRNYDILAAVFTDVLKFMHDDLDLL